MHWLRVGTILTLLTLLASPAAAQTGIVTGSVTDTVGAPVADATVMLRQGQMGPPDYQALTDTLGEFSIAGVDTGQWNARAMKSGLGMDEQSIHVGMNETVNAYFVLDGMGGNMGGHQGMELDTLSVSGWTITEPHPVHDSLLVYFLDEEDDGTAEYLLGFGPPGYEPESGATLPVDGEQVDIFGGLMTGWMGGMGNMGGGFVEDSLAVIVVYEINDLTWFDPLVGGHHNGMGGSWHAPHECSWNEPDAVSAQGYALVDTTAPLFMNHYWLDEENDGEAEFRLNFGGPGYDPGNGAARPDSGDWVEITGALITGCPVEPTILVYTINGQFWRSPGDTTELGTDALNGVPASSGPARPGTALLVEAYPNPFNPTTTVRLTTPEQGSASVMLYDVLGRRVASVHEGPLNAGTHRMTLSGEGLPAGIYFLRAQAAGQSSTQRLVLMK